MLRRTEQMPKNPRKTPLLVPLSYTTDPDGQVRLDLAPGVEWAIGQKKRARRFNAEPVKAFFARYQEAGGDRQRLKRLLEGLLPVKPPRPPTRKALKQIVRRASEASKTLDELLALPGNLPGHETRWVFKRAAGRLRRFVDQAQEEHLAQLKPRKPPLVAVEIPARVIPGSLIRSGFHGGSASLVLSRPAGDRRPQFPLVPPIGSPVRGRIRSGSATGLILGVLAKECKRRFETFGWGDIVELVCAIAPETFPRDPQTAERLRKRVQAVSKKQRSRKYHIAFLHAKLFPAD